MIKKFTGTDMFLSDRQNYKFTNGIYSFLDEKTLTGDNLKYNKLYNRIAWFYNLSQRFYFWLTFGGEKKFREPFLSELEIKNNDKVLEICTGTGDNFRFLNKQATYFGADFSMEMLKQAKKHVKQWGINATFVHCNGENLPFKDEYFDVVLHCGGINYFIDKQKSINEMIRVAKSGAKLLIVDETDQLVKENYQKNLLIKKNYVEAEKAIIPIEIIPTNMIEIKAEIICKGLMYKLTFIKP
jgi:ubiquinone/menaquinone biosynthesis C-methylase UbiE